MIIPVRDNIYILPIEEIEQVGSIVVPEAAKKRPTEGIVKYRGPLTSGEIKVGDHVIFSGYDGDKLILNDEGPLVVMQERFIKAVWTEGESYLFTPEQIKVIIMKAAGETASRFGEDERKQRLVLATAHRMCDQLDSHFYAELHF